MATETIELGGRKVRVETSHDGATAEVVGVISEAKRVFNALEEVEGVQTDMINDNDTYVAWVREDKDVSKITSTIDTRKRDSIDIKRLEPRAEGGGLYVAWGEDE